ncbi:hypothetical protein B0H14DRAFT_2564295 [Mycena olivaceomarginata]|nr:hypothetical protein B0H14DRAFT_2564295 [Mycena olivaceomarginata]
MHPDPPECEWPESLSSKPFGMGWEFGRQECGSWVHQRRETKSLCGTEQKSPDGEQQTEQSSNLELLRSTNNTRHCGSRTIDNFGFGIIEIAAQFGQNRNEVCRSSWAQSVEKSDGPKELKIRQEARETPKEQGYKGKEHRISTISLKNG